MDTNAITTLLQMLANKPAVPNGDFWSQMMPYFVMLIIAVVAWIKANTIERKTDVATVKREEMAKTIGEIKTDVNNNTTVANQRIIEQQARLTTATEKITSLESKLSPAPLITDAHIEQLAKRVSELTK